MMRKDIRLRVLEEARYFIDHNSTVRATANALSAKDKPISKSTIHKDLSERLPEISPPLSDKVRIILNKNTEERHLRGGESTRQKYLKRN